MTSDDAVLQRWVEAVDRLASDHVPTSGELEAVAHDLGLGADVLARATRRAEDLETQASGFLREGLVAEAVACRQTARDLEPWSVDRWVALGEAHLEAHRAAPTSATSTAVEDVARHLIQAAPERQDGYRLLAGVKEVARGRWRRPLLTAGAVGVAGLLGWGVGLQGGTARAPTVAPDVAQIPDPPPPPPVERAEPAMAMGPIAHRVVTGPLPEGVTLEVVDADFTPFVDSEGWSIGVAVRLDNGGQVVLQEVAAELRAFDTDGNLLATNALAVLSEHGAAVHPGERTGEHGYVTSTFRMGRPAWVEVAVVASKHHAGRGVQGERVPVDTHMLGAGQAIELRLRQGACRPNPLMKQTFCDLDLVVENTGTVAFEMLKLEVELGPDAKDSTWAVSSSEPPLQPGERQPVHIVEFVEVAHPPEGWTYTVVGARGI